MKRYLFLIFQVVLTIGLVTSLAWSGGVIPAPSLFADPYTPATGTLSVIGGLDVAGDIRITSVTGEYEGPAGTGDEMLFESNGLNDVDAYIFDAVGTPMGLNFGHTSWKLNGVEVASLGTSGSFQTTGGASFTGGNVTVRGGDFRLEEGMSLVENDNLSRILTVGNNGLQPTILSGAKSDLAASDIAVVIDNVVVLATTGQKIVSFLDGPEGGAGTERASLDITGEMTLNGGIHAGNATGSVDVPNILGGAVTEDLAIVAAAQCDVGATVTITGAAGGDPCFVGVVTNPADLIFACGCFAADSCRVRVCNPTASGIDPVSQTYTLRVFDL